MRTQHVGYHLQGSDTHLERKFFSSESLGDILLYIVGASTLYTLLTSIYMTLSLPLILSLFLLFLSLSLSLSPFAEVFSSSSQIYGNNDRVV